MIPDGQADSVFISDQLEGRFPALVDGLRQVLDEHCIPLRTIRGTRDIWCRDFMPVQVGPGEFVQFRYKPDYLREFEHLITRPCDIEAIPEIQRCATSEIVLDGGNVVGWGRRCIVTDKVFRENRGTGKNELIERLRELLAVEEVVVIPKEPYDVVGHADGVLRFFDEETAVINDYSMLDRSYGDRLKSVLRRSMLKWIEVPYKPRAGQRGELPPAFGNYVNFLRVGDLVVLPGYAIPENDEARGILEQALPGVAVAQVDCSALSMEGGALNCVTWNVAERRVLRGSP